MLLREGKGASNCIKHCFPPRPPYLLTETIVALGDHVVI